MINFLLCRPQVHETIQPVINRETVQNTHVHTTVPIHEKIHDAPIVHEHTVLPTVSLSECEFEAWSRMLSDNGAYTETSWFQAEIVQAKVGGEHQHKDGDHKHAYYEGSPRVSLTSLMLGIAIVD